MNGVNYLDNIVVTPSTPSTLYYVDSTVTLVKISAANELNTAALVGVLVVANNRSNEDEDYVNAWVWKITANDSNVILSVPNTTIYSNSTEKSTKHKMSGGEIAAIVLASVFGALFFAFLGLYVHERHHGAYYGQQPPPQPYYNTARTGLLPA